MSSHPHLSLGVLGSGRGSNLQSILDAIASGTLAARVACVLAEGQGWIEPAHLHLPEVVAMPAPRGATTLREQSRLRVQQTLTECGGNVSEAARRLGISRTTLYRALREEG